MYNMQKIKPDHQYYSIPTSDGQIIFLSDTLNTNKALYISPTLQTEQRGFRMETL